MEGYGGVGRSEKVCSGSQGHREPQRASASSPSSTSTVSSMEEGGRDRVPLGGCSRELRPFKAQYMLVVHMRRLHGREAT